MINSWTGISTIGVDDPGCLARSLDAARSQLASALDFSSFEFDRKPLVIGHIRRVVIRRPDTTPARYSYTRWAGGTDSDSCISRSGISTAVRAQRCEPLITADDAAVAIHGHLNRDGTLISSLGGTASCDATQNHSGCGFYREFDTNRLPTDTVPCERLTVNILRFREFCEGS